MRVIAIAAVLFLLAASAGWGSAAGSASHAKTRWRATLATPPANAATDERQGVSIDSISCASPGNCTAVGGYVDKAGHWEGLLLNETAGQWGRGREAVLPANRGSDPGVYLPSVSCASAGNCAAVGTYNDASSTEDDHVTDGFFLTENAGHWGVGAKARPPRGSDQVSYLNSVSCASAGYCVAVGSDGFGRGLLFTEEAGHWARGVGHGGQQGGDLVSVSCGSNRSCSAVGVEEYDPCDGRDGCPTAYPVVLTKHGRRWRGNDVHWPLGGAAFVDAVSCPAANECSAAGVNYPSVYGIDAETIAEGVLLTEKAGKWAGVLAKAPKNAKSDYWKDAVDVFDISCGAPRECLAAGIYHGRRSVEHLTMLTEKAGRWHRGVEAVLPRGAKRPYPSAVSCASPGNCTVVGSYGNTDYLDGPGEHGFLSTESAGRWARGIRPPRFSGAFDSVFAVSCASPGNCGAVGADWTPDGAAYGVLFDSTTK